MARPANNFENCPICGKLVPTLALVAGALKQHRCPRRSLLEKDNKHSGDDGSARLFGHTFQERLKDGFDIMRDDG
jgi:hypothetical protein